MVALIWIGNGSWLLAPGSNCGCYYFVKMGGGLVVGRMGYGGRFVIFTIHTTGQRFPFIMTVDTNKLNPKHIRDALNAMYYRCKGPQRRGSWFFVESTTRAHVRLAWITHSISLHPKIPREGEGQDPELRSGPSCQFSDVSFKRPLYYVAIQLRSSDVKYCVR